MRTTVDIPDEVYRKVKVTAAEQGVTVRELVLEGLEIVMRANLLQGGSVGLEVFASAEPDSLEIEQETSGDVIGFP